MAGPGADTKSLLRQSRNRILGPQVQKSKPTQVVVRPISTPGPMGLNDAAASLSQPKSLPPLEVHLDLAELVQLNEVIEHGRSGLIKKGQPFNTDPGRPQKVLEIVTSFFTSLGKAIHISLGSGTKSDRFLRAGFSWGMDPDVGGVSAQGISRTNMGKFNRMAEDQAKPVTAYVFEGVIGNWIVEYLGGACSNIDNLFAAIIAHELGHNLGLTHSKSLQNIMFAFREGSKDSRTKWLQLCAKKEVKFEQNQMSTVKALLLRP